VEKKKYGQTAPKRAAAFLLAILLTATLSFNTYASEPFIRTQAAAESVPGGIRGIDVSSWQGGNIDWQKVSRDNVHYAMLRASAGMNPDVYFYRNATQAHQNGIKVGAYHYARFTNYNTMLREAQLFISQLRTVTLTYPAVLDIEQQRGIPKAELTRLSILFLEQVKDAGFDVMIYSYDNFFTQSLEVHRLGDYKKWVANYTREPNRGQVMWQYTENGRVSGVTGPVDLNVAYRDLSTGVIRISGEVSNHIKQTLNVRYNAALPLDTLDINQMNRVIAYGLQREINAITGVESPIYDRLGEEALHFLGALEYVPGHTMSNIFYLIQVSLFYKGYFEGYQSSHYDEYTEWVIGRFQRQNGIYPDGIINAETINALFA
jgi:lysozyme